VVWNPLADDGDALRLAVKCRIGFVDVLSGKFVRVSHRSIEPLDEPIALNIPFYADPYAATRRAIVRVAAEIGKATGQEEQKPVELTATSKEGLIKLLNVLAPESPINQDQLGGCVWCAGTPPGRPYGYAGTDPSHHKPDCPWVRARAIIDQGDTP
jgi:hypothetical protein